MLLFARSSDHCVQSHRMAGIHYLDCLQFIGLFYEFMEESHCSINALCWSLSVHDWLYPRVAFVCAEPIKIGQDIGNHEQSENDCDRFPEWKNIETR